MLFLFEVSLPRSLSLSECLSWHALHSNLSAEKEWTILFIPCPTLFLSTHYFLDVIHCISFLFLCLPLHLHFVVVSLMASLLFFGISCLLSMILCFHWLLFALVVFIILFFLLRDHILLWRINFSFLSLFGFCPFRNYASDSWPCYSFVTVHFLSCLCLHFDMLVIVTMPSDCAKTCLILAFSIHELLRTKLHGNSLSLGTWDKESHRKRSQCIRKCSRIMIPHAHPSIRLLLC
jgi:hypothetical protein